MDVCPECGKPWPCATCGDSSDLAHLPPVEEQIKLGRRAAWYLHLLRRSFAADGKVIAMERTEEVIRIVDDLVSAVRETGIH
jgi:hypothetical protein